ncbi:MAG: alpha/beta hydrolase [Anaerolineae bacterium]|nr:alpha/beta hydrolase [Anaerolineae bacterium]
MPWRILIVIALLGLSACSQSGGVDLDKLVDIGTHSLHIRCIGKGHPVVVIDTGHGDLLDSWQSIQAQIGQYTRVCAYDRAGYGSSEPGPMPRHSQRIADELELLLDQARVGGPYVLVGHSLGAANMQVFASRYPDQVAGLILLDPPPLQLITGQAFPELHRMAEQEAAGIHQMAEAARQAADTEGQARAGFLAAAASELETLFGEGAAQVAAVESFGDIPLVVIGSGKANPAFGEVAEDYQQFWIEQSRALTQKSTQGRFILAQESGHHLHKDAPDLVLDTIRQVVKEARVK